MKAAQYNEYGDTSVIVINDNASTPSLKPSQVLVEVYASSINPIDYKVREGYMKEHVPLQFPVTIGGNFSGVVTQVGNGVTNFKVGDDIFGQALVLNGGSGSMAEFASVNTKNVFIVNHLERKNKWRRKKKFISFGRRLYLLDVLFLGR